jgi:hypothetical protein
VELGGRWPHETTGAWRSAAQNGAISLELRWSGLRTVVGRSPPDASMVSDRSPEDEALPQSRAAKAGVPPQPCENAAPPISPHARSLISPSSPAVTNRRGGFKVGRTTPARPARAKRQRATSPHRQERVDAHTSGGHGDAERRADQEQDSPSFLAGPVRHVGVRDALADRHPGHRCAEQQDGPDQMQAVDNRTHSRCGAIRAAGSWS